MQVPAAIGRYPVTGVIGTGAFSAVYRAIDERLGSEVAIKLLGDHHSLDPEIRERFLTEARLMRRISSEHVVALFELAENERQQPYLVMELIAGGNLAAHRRLLVGRGNPITAADVALLASALAAALTTLHAQQVVHRDLSPANVLLRRGADAVVTGDRLFADDEQAVLADLGLSKDLARSSGLTVGGGTQGFSAPEQRSAGTIDVRADVYAVSALLSWLITGTPPSGPDDAAGVATAGWPQLAAALRRGLAAKPTDRPATIGDWHAAIDEALTPAAPPSEPSSTPTTSAPSAAQRSPRRLWLGATVALFAVGGVAGYLAADDGGDGEPTTELIELSGDNVRAERTDGAVTVAIEGPATLTEGASGTYRAEVTGTEQFLWLDRNGTSLADEPAINVTPQSPGAFPLTLVATSAAGTPIVVTLEVVVTAAPGTTG